MTPEFLQQLLAREVVRDFLRFAAVGAVATAVHYAVLIGLTEIFGVHPVLGTACGALTGGVVSYTLNRIYTFAARPAYMRGLVKFIIVISIGAALNAAIVAFFMWLGLWYLFAQFIATGIVLIWNFAVSRVVVFREP
jgi:putative flippase GtrA